MGKAKEQVESAMKLLYVLENNGYGTKNTREAHDHLYEATVELGIDRRNKVAEL